MSRSRKLAVLGVAVSLLALPLMAAAMSHEKMEHGMMMPKAEGKVLWEYVTKTSPYQEWALFPGKGKLYEGRHPHGAFLTTYVNKGALTALTEKTGMVPDGGVIVKENYSPEKQLAAVTIMYRVKGYNPEAGDWFWAKYGADGTIEKEGKVEGCINCHGGVIQNDWIFTGPVK